MFFLKACKVERWESAEIEASTVNLMPMLSIEELRTAGHLHNENWTHSQAFSANWVGLDLKGPEWLNHFLLLMQPMH